MCYVRQNGHNGEFYFDEEPSSKNALGLGMLMDEAFLLFELFRQNH